MLEKEQIANDSYLSFIRMLECNYVKTYAF